MDEDLLKKLAEAGDDLANSIMSAHISGATKGADIIKSSSSTTAKVVEEKAKAGAEFISQASEKTAKVVTQAASTAGEKLSQAFEGMSDLFGNNLKNIGEAFVKQVTGEEFSNNIKKVFASTALDIRNQLTNIAVNAGIELNEETTEKFARIGLSSAVILLNLKNIESIKPFDNLSKDGEEFANKVSGNIKNLTENVLPSIGVAGPVKGIISTIGSFEAVADSAKSFESSILSAAGAAGRYYDILQRVDNFNGEGFERFASQFVNKAADIGNATNQNAKDVMAWQQTLMQIRGGLDAVVESLGEAAQDTDVLTAAITVSAGAGLKVKDTLDMMTAQYMNFGTAAEDSLEDIAKLAIVAQDLEVPLDKIKGGVNSVVSSLIYYRDNTEAAVNITARLGASLKEAGMSPEAISKLTTTVAQNVAGMQLAQRAFLSQQTGGPGGLAGGYQIELLKQQGKLDEVQKLAEEALKKQFGGRIVTLQEASQDEGAARQLAKQVQLATSGPTKLVENESQAFALFEAMKKGTTADVLTGTDAINQAATQGQERLARQESEINKLNNAAIAAASQASLMAAESSRLVSQAFRDVVQNTQGLIRSNPITNSVVSSLLPTTEQATQQALRTEMVGYATPTMDRPNTSSEQLLATLRKAAGIVSESASGESLMDFSKFSNPTLSENMPAANKGVAEAGSKMNFGTIIVETVCSDCNTKHAKEVAVRVVNEGIAEAGRASRVNAAVGHSVAH